MESLNKKNINTITALSILSLLREEDFSRFDLVNELSLDKDEVYTTVDSLIEDGFVVQNEEGSGDYTTPFIHLTLSKTKGRIITFVFGEVNITATATNLKGNVLRFERFPRGEYYKDSIRSFYGKMSKDHADLYGVVVVSDDKSVLEDDFFPCPFTIINNATASAKAEIKNKNYQDRTYFVSLSDEITSSFYVNNTLVPISSFAHIKVSSGTTCSCGIDGCLSSIISGKVLKKKTGINNYKVILNSEEGLKAISDGEGYLAFALSKAIQSIDAESVVLLGELSNISEYLYAKINNTLSISLPPGKRYVSVTKGERENAAQEGATLYALDSFFYHEDILKKLKILKNVNF